MKLPVLLLLIATCGFASGTPERPSVDLELVRTPILENETDLYVLVTNPNRFTIQIPRGFSGTKTIVGGAIHFGSGIAFRHPDDFMSLNPGERVMLFVNGKCQLAKGQNEIRVEVGTTVLNEDRLPQNATLVKHQALTLEVLNE